MPTSDMEVRKEQEEAALNAWALAAIAFGQPGKVLDNTHVSRARREPDWELFDIAKQAEFQALWDNKTWDLVELSSEKRFTGTQMLCERKLEAMGSLSDITGAMWHIATGKYMASTTGRCGSRWHGIQPYACCWRTVLWLGSSWDRWMLRRLCSTSLSMRIFLSASRLDKYGATGARCVDCGKHSKGLNRPPAHGFSILERSGGSGPMPSQGDGCRGSGLHPNIR